MEIQRLTTDQAIKEVFTRRKWYVNVGASLQLANFYKRQFEKGKLTQEIKDRILISHGFNKVEYWY